MSDFLSKKAAEPGVYAFPSGLLVKILKKGQGKTHPLVGTQCTCHYEGTLTDGTVFDSSYARGEPIDFAPNQVIPGWTEALQMMREGDQWEVTLPYTIAYGARGMPPVIPPKSTLVFKMEIVKIRGAAKTVSDDIFVSLFGKTYAEM